MKGDGEFITSERYVELSIQRARGEESRYSRLVMVNGKCPYILFLASIIRTLETRFVSFSALGVRACDLAAPG